MTAVLAVILCGMTVCSGRYRIFAYRSRRQIIGSAAAQRKLMRVGIFALSDIFSKAAKPRSYPAS